MKYLHQPLTHARRIIAKGPVNPEPKRERVTVERERKKLLEAEKERKMK